MEKQLINEIANEYIETLILHENSTAYAVNSVYKMHIQEFAKGMHLKDVTIQTIQDLQRAMREKKHKNKRYSKKTINNVTWLFNKIMNFSVIQGYMDRNPCDNFKPLKVVKRHEINEVEFWTDKEFIECIRYEENPMWYCFIMVAYMTGMRKGEVRGLRWKDINFTKKTLSINRHINDKILADQRFDDSWQVIDGRKNGDTHVLGLNDVIVKLLSEWKQEEMKAPGWSSDWYIFGRVKPVGQNSPNRHMDKIAELSGEKRITIHGLRHSHVSYLIDRGLNVYEIAERIGDTVQMVLEVYGHMFPDPQKNIVNALNMDFNTQFSMDKLVLY